MAAYAATVTLNTRVSHRLVPGLRIVAGEINITNYNTTVAEITDITKHFRNTPTVILGGVSSGGYVVNWDTSDKGVKAWYPTDETGVNADRVAAEAATDDTVGTVSFIAIGTD